MTESVLFSAIGLIFAVAVFVILAVRGTSPIISALIATALISFVALGGFYENFFNTFLTGMTGLFGSFFLQFTFGCLFGEILSATGAADRMGKTLVGWMGQSNFVYAIIIVTILFGLTGAPPIAMMPGLTFALLKHANLPRYVGMVAVCGAASVSSVVPSTLGLANVLPTIFLGTDVYAAPELGLIAGAVGLVCVCYYCNRLMKKARENNIGYEPMDGKEFYVREDSDMPSFAWSIIPVIFVLVLCAVLILAADLQTTWAMVFSTTGGILLLLLFNGKYMHIKPLIALRHAAEGIQPIIVCSLAVCGFSAVVTNTALYQKVIPVLSEWNVHPAILVVVGQMLFAALCADPISSVGAFTGTIGSSLVKGGASAVLVHRLSTISSTTFDTMPHAGAVTLALRMFGYDLKSGYKYLVMVNLVIPVIFTIVALIAALILY